MKDILESRPEYFHVVSMDLRLRHLEIGSSLLDIGYSKQSTWGMPVNGYEHNQYMPDRIAIPLDIIIPTVKMRFSVCYV